MKFFWSMVANRTEIRIRNKDVCSKIFFSDTMH